MGIRLLAEARTRQRRFAHEQNRQREAMISREHRVIRRPGGATVEEDGGWRMEQRALPIADCRLTSAGGQCQAGGGLAEGSRSNMRASNFLACSNRAGGNRPSRRWIRWRYRISGAGPRLSQNTNRAALSGSGYPSQTPPGPDGGARRAVGRHVAGVEVAVGVSSVRFGRWAGLAHSALCTERRHCATTSPTCGRGEALPSDCGLWRGFTSRPS